MITVTAITTEGGSSLKPHAEEIYFGFLDNQELTHLAGHMFGESRLIVDGLDLRSLENFLFQLWKPQDFPYETQFGIWICFDDDSRVCSTTCPTCAGNGEHRLILMEPVKSAQIFYLQLLTRSVELFF